MGDQIVAAIDFGTTFSGYAYSFAANKDAIYINKNWGTGSGVQLHKNKTCVLLNSDGEFDAFGFQASKKYHRLSYDDSRKYYFFDRFKMKLFENESLSTSTRIEAVNCKVKPAVDVFALSLRFMKGHLYSALQNTPRGIPRLIQWVITVPAIWDENAKQFMREAAFRGGLISTRDSNQLSIVLEPEAASLFCRGLSNDKFVGHSSHTVDSRPAFVPGSKYVLVDAGGGTVDCVAHTVGEDKRLKELSKASGGPWGGTMVDKEFLNLLENIFGIGFMNEFKHSHPNDFQTIMDDFEIKKRDEMDYDGGNNFDESESVRILLPYNFCNYRHNGVIVEQAIEVFKNQNSGVDFDSGYLELTPERFSLLFKDVIQKIIDHVEELLKEHQTRDVKHIFLVGGFADSSRLHNAFMKHFDGRITCHVPEEASLAVVRGAVAFGHDTSAISQRICRFTYGVDVYRYFKEGEHREDLKVMVDGVVKCRDMFDTWVEAGDVVSHNHKLKKGYVPLKTGQTAMQFDFYRSTRKNIKYIDEPWMEKCGSMEIQMPDLTGEKKRTVDLEVIFGGTEIQVSAHDHTSGNDCETTIDFLAV